MMEKIDSAVFSDDYIIFGDRDFEFVTFFVDDIGLNSISLFNINLYDENFDYCDPETINHVRLMGWYNKFKQCKSLKKKIDEQLLLVVWHPTR